MSHSKTSRFTLALLGLAIAGSVAAQQPPQDFPNERERPRTCEEFSWDAEMTRVHPRVVAACQEAVFVGGEHWARLAARFVRTASEGEVVFTIRDARDRVVEEITLQTVPGQVAYINDVATPFGNLRPSDSMNLYVPEGRYGYALQAGAPPDQVVRLAPRRQASPPPRTELAAVPSQSTPMARADTRMPSELPQTAGTLPWVLLGGFMTLLSGLVLTVMRKW